MSSVHPSRSWLSLIAFLGFLALALVACDSGGDNGGGDGEGDGSFPEPPGRPGFTSTVTGDWQAAWSGTAVHVMQSASESPITIRLQAAEEASTAITLMADGALQPGMHAIQEDGRGITARLNAPRSHGRWTGVSGELHIEASDGTSITGRFRLVAASEAGGLVTAAGAFVSTPAQ